MKKNQNGFSAVIIMISIVVVAVMGLAGWLVYQRSNDNDETANSDTTQYDGVVILELGIKVKDPESRVFSVAEVEVAAVNEDSTAKVYALTPSDYPEEFSSVCEYPAYISETDSEDSSNTVKIGENNFFVGKTILGCGGSDEMSTYLEELHTYILDNVVSL